MANICLDVDGVICDIAEGLNRQLDKMGMDGYDYAHLIVGGFEDDFSRGVFGSNLFWKNLKPFVDAWYCVNSWWGKGFDIFFVTARKADAAQASLIPWLDAWGFNYTDIFFKDMGEKSDVICELDPLFMIEDNPYEVRKIIESGYPCFLRRAWYNSVFWDDFNSVGNLFDVSDFFKEVL